jgi:guanine deaminase
MAWHQSLVAENGPVTVQDAANLLFGVMMVGDERNIDETWIFGNRAYKKA